MRQLRHRFRVLVLWVAEMPGEELLRVALVLGLLICKLLLLLLLQLLLLLLQLLLLLLVKGGLAELVLQQLGCGSLKLDMALLLVVGFDLLCGI